MLLYIFLFLLLVVIVVLIVRKVSKPALSQYCQTNSDCPASDYCTSNPEMGGKSQCFPLDKKFCGFDPPTSLVKCDPKDPDSCSGCLNTPAFGCVVVDDSHPYIWKQGEKKINIPNSPTGFGWCLPNIVNRDVTCNNFTADYVLEQVGDNSYQWACHCKYPNLFDKTPGSDDCTVVRACGGSSNPVSLIVPTQNSCKVDSDCKEGVCRSPMIPAPCGYDNGNSGLEPSVDCSKEGSSCFCHVPWQGKVTEEIDPLAGRCECREGDIFQCLRRASDYTEMNCVQSTCGVWPTKTSGCNNCPPSSGSGTPCICCDCPTGYLSCPGDIPNQNTNLITYCQNTGATCIEDPCSAGAPGGHFDYKSGECVCPDGYASVQDDLSPVFRRCENLCKANGQCSNRGTCYVTKDEAGKSIALCKDCSCPYTNDGDDKTCMCMGISSTLLPEGSDCCHDSECCSQDCRNADCHDEYYPTKGKCTFGAVVMPNNPCVPVTPPAPVKCDSENTCPAKQTCCKDPSKSWVCCPLEDAVCCDDGLHCCPNDYPICDPSIKGCRNKDNTKSVPWSGAK